MDLHADAIKILEALPWIGSVEKIIAFMLKIPVDKTHLRKHLTVYHFIATRDATSKFHETVETDAIDIKNILSDANLIEVKERLTSLGSLPNRKEVVIRQLLYKHKDLFDNKLKEISLKRRIFSFETNNDSNFKIKIRKTDDLFEVVSTFRNDNSPFRNDNKLVSTSVIEHLPDSSSSHDPEVQIKNQDVLTTDGQAIENQLDSEDTIILDDYKSGSESGTSEKLDPIPLVRTASVIAAPPIRYAVNTIVSSTIDKTAADGVSELKDDCSFEQVDSVILNLINSFKNNDILNAPNLQARITSTPQEIVNNTENSQKGATLLVTPSTSKDLPMSKETANLQAKITSTPQEIVNHTGNSLSKAALLATPSTSKDLPMLDETDHDYNLPSTSKFAYNALKEHIRVRSFAQQPASERQEPLPVTLPTEEPGPSFNILEYLKAITEQPIEKIQQFCKSHGLDIQKKPSDAQLDSAVVYLLKDSKGSDEETSFIYDDDSDLDEDDVELDKPYVTQTVTTVPAPQLPASGAVQNIVDLTIPKADKVHPDSTLIMNRISEMFPEACPNYVRRICQGKNISQVDEIVTEIIMTDDTYPRRPVKAASPEKEIDPEEQLEILKDVLPDADPTYLQMQCEKYRSDRNGLKEFVEHALKYKNYPTLREYKRKQQLSAQQKHYTTCFNVENFMQLFPDPLATFSDKKRNTQYSNLDVHYISLFLRNKFDTLNVRDIAKAMSMHKNRPYSCYVNLSKQLKQGITLKSRRKHYTLPDNIQNIPLLQELAFLEHQSEIKQYLNQKKVEEEQERKIAKQDGLLQTCSCCYDDEVMPKDTFKCEKGCTFCNSCIKKSCEVALGDAKLNFPCLADCGAEFSLQTLQNSLPPKLFSKLAQKKALAEVKAAGIKDLETCPFCDFATIPYEGDKIFRCQNPECMKESCRLCKEASHVPLKCDEVEKDADVKTRTFIENKMTEALLRKCWKCSTSFYKEEGCNKMTCSCGANMCYVCGKPVKDYSHFNGMGGTQYHLCPLYSNANELNKENVLKAAEEAKAQVDPNQLKVDPAADIHEHYKKRASELPREPYMDLLHHMGPQNRNRLLQQPARQVAMAHAANQVQPHHHHRQHNRHHQPHHHHHHQHQQQQHHQPQPPRLPGLDDIIVAMDHAYRAPPPYVQNPFEFN